MVGRATAAIQAALQHWNNAAWWEYLLTSHVCSASAGYAFQMPGYDRPQTFEAAFPSPSASIPPRSTALADSTAAQSAATANWWGGPTGVEYRYHVPQKHVRAIYNMRDLTQPRTLYFINKLRLDRAHLDHTWDVGEAGDTPAMDSPVWWEWTLAGGGQFRTIPVQSQTTEILVRYFRHMELYPFQTYYLAWYPTAGTISTVVSSTGNLASADATIDIPIMYEDYIVAKAASRLLTMHTDKKELADDLKAYHDEGLMLAMQDNGKHKLDEDVVIVPNNEDPNPMPLSYENLTRYQVDALR
jgi:hypothetical protein